MRVGPLWFGSLCAQYALSQTTLSFPSSPPSTNQVNSNFLGISIELSIVNSIIGETTTSIPQPMLNLLKNIRQRMGDKTPLRIRIGGNSMDSSTFVQNQTNMLSQMGTAANSNDIPVSFGPSLFQVSKALGQNIGGAKYVLGLSLRDPSSSNVPLLASAAEQGLGGDLDAFLLGNEPDLYTPHGNRPEYRNYTSDIYISEWGGMMNTMHDSQYGNLLQKRLLGGPTICCNWDLQTLLNSGYISNFTNVLKYVSVQHYPQNQCGGKHAHGLDLYTQHSLVVKLAQWNGAGVQTAVSSNISMMMSEFNTASCGGIPGISDTFASTLWIVDYTLQMASIGYSAAYIHTRERGVSYNLFDPPESPSNSSWKTLPSYYALLPIADALHSNSGNVSVVYDLNVTGSAINNGSLSGPEDNSTTAAEFKLDSSTFDVPVSGKVGVRYLAAPSITENENISWGGQTLAGTGDGRMVASKASTASSYSQTDVSCASGCSIEVPGPGLAVVWLDGAVPQNMSGEIRMISCARWWSSFLPSILVIAGLMMI